MDAAALAGLRHSSASHPSAVCFLTEAVLMETPLLLSSLPLLSFPLFCSLQRFSTIRDGPERSCNNAWNH